MITYEIRSYTGSRDHNEDYAGVSEKKGCYCFALADGLGGHGKGEIASKLAVEAALAEFDEADLTDEIGGLFESAQEAVMSEQKKQNAYSQMKTTLTILEVRDDKILWGHIGDTRIYYFQRKRLLRRTFDHSVPQMLALSGQIREKDIRHHEDRNRLLRVIGVPWERRQYEINLSAEHKKHQAFLMCTDGWWEWIEEKQMEECLKRSKSVEEWMDLMEQVIKKQGNGTDMDNFSAIGIFLN